MKRELVRDPIGPVLGNPAQARVAHWTGVKVHSYLKQQPGVDLGYCTAVRNYAN